MLVAGEATTNLKNLFAPDRIDRGGDPGKRLDILKRLTRLGQVVDQRADFERLVSLRFFQPFPSR